MTNRTTKNWKQTNDGAVIKMISQEKGLTARVATRDDGAWELVVRSSTIGVIARTTVTDMHEADTIVGFFDIA